MLVVDEDGTGVNHLIASPASAPARNVVADGYGGTVVPLWTSATGSPAFDSPDYTTVYAGGDANAGTGNPASWKLARARARHRRDWHARDQPRQQRQRQLRRHAQVSLLPERVRSAARDLVVLREHRRHGHRHHAVGQRAHGGAVAHGQLGLRGAPAGRHLARRLGGRRRGGGGVRTRRPRRTRRSTGHSTVRACSPSTTATASASAPCGPASRAAPARLRHPGCRRRHARLHRAEPVDHRAARQRLGGVVLDHASIQ